MAKQLEQFVVTLEVDGPAMSKRERAYVALQISEAVAHWRRECGLSSDDSDSVTYLASVRPCPGLIDSALAVVDGDAGEIAANVATLGRALVVAGYGD